MKARGILLAIVPILALAASADAKPGYFVSGAGEHAVLSFPASKGFNVKVEASSAGPKNHQRFFVAARKGPAEVTYVVDGSLGADGSVQLHLPHVGRITVEFDPVHVTRRRPPDNCKGRPTIVEHGYFRGTIELHGEREYTTVDRGSARGRFVHSFRRVCKSSPSEDGSFYLRRSEQPKGLSFTFLIASRQSPAVTFMAGRMKFGSDAIPPFFRASRVRLRDGMIVGSSVNAEGKSEDLVISKLGKPKVAEVSPPAPFEGSATFSLSSPKASTWKGDLAVELPGVGQVPLVGESFSSALCKGFHCTGTGGDELSAALQIVS